MQTACLMRLGIGQTHPMQWVTLRKALVWGDMSHRVLICMFTAVSGTVDGRLLVNTKIY